MTVIRAASLLFVSYPREGALVPLESVHCVGGGFHGEAGGGHREEGTDPVLSLPGGGVGVLFTIYVNFFFLVGKVGQFYY